MPRSKSSNRWLQEHFADEYVKKAQREGYRSRAVYKLKEINEKEKLLRPGMVVVDLGAAPGGWCQYVTEILQGTGRVIALDLLPIEPLPCVECIEGDFSEENILEQLLQRLPKQGVDLLLSDLAPNMSGTPAVDIPRAMYLVELVFDFARTMLKPGGTLFVKVFHGVGFDALIREARTAFTSLSIRKPHASRSRSRETYLLAKGYKLV